MPHSLLKVDWCSSEMLVDFQQTTKSYIPGGRSLHDHHCENLKSYILRSCLENVRNKRSVQVKSLLSCVGV
jgi:hypothetical protein